MIFITRLDDERLRLLPGVPSVSDVATYRDSLRASLEREQAYSRSILITERDAALSREAALLKGVEDVEGMAKVLFAQNSNGEWEALTENAQNEYLDAARALCDHLLGADASIAADLRIKELEGQPCRAREAIFMTRHEIIALDPDREPMGSNWPYKVIDGVMTAVRSKANLSSTGPCRHEEEAKQQITTGREVNEVFRQGCCRGTRRRAKEGKR